MSAEFLVNIDVDDLEAATQFYCAAFGLRVGRSFDTGFRELLGGSTHIYLLAKPAGSQAALSTAQTRAYTRHWTPLHLDVVVDDIAVAVDRAVRAGANLEGAISEHVWGKLAVCADPFGHGFCFVQFVGRGYGEIASE